MAWRIEVEEDGRESIVMDGWGKGMSPDPYSGINRLYSVDLSVPGEVAVGYTITANATSGATLGTPIADSTRFAPYGSGGYVPSGSAQSFAILDSGGHVFESTSITGTFTFLSSSNSTTNSGSTDGIAYWLGYLWKTRGTTIDYWNGSTWATGFSTALTAGVKHFMYVASDNVLYITNGNYLASLSASSPDSFDPTNTGTYTFSATKLRLPTYDVAISLAEVGSGNTPSSTLLVGGIMNSIYPWDKVSSSFALPIYVGESYIRLMISANQNAYIFTGNQQGRGRIFITNGSQADEFFKMPDYAFGEQDPYYVFGDAIFHRNNLIFGCFVNKNSGSGTLLISEVFAIDLETKAFRAISDIPTNATGKGNAVCLISTGSLSSPGFGYIIAWDDNGSAPGIGYSGTTAGIGSAVVITDLMDIGSFLKKRTIENIEYKLRSALQSGESVSVTPLVDGASGTALVFSPTPATGVFSGEAPTTFEKAQWLQFQISLTGNSATSGVRFKELRMRLSKPL